MKKYMLFNNTFINIYFLFERKLISLKNLNYFNFFNYNYLKYKHAEKCCSNTTSNTPTKEESIYISRCKFEDLL
jgi:hypothetical protein